MFSALAGVIMLFEIPLFFAPSFYKMDLSEIPVLICTFYLGPVAGVVCEFKGRRQAAAQGHHHRLRGRFRQLRRGLLHGAARFLLYHCKKSKSMALVGLAVGTVVMAVFGSAFNAFYLLPKFAQLYGMPLDAIIGMGTQVNPAITSVGTLVLFSVVPFNLLKGVVVSALTLVLYKRVERLFFRSAQPKAQAHSTL